MNPIVGASGMEMKAQEALLSAGRPAERLYFFDRVRNVAMLCVILYHAVAAYSTATPHWSVHDGASVVADGIRHLFDVFMMPVFFFVAGYFALPGLRRQGAWGFFKGKGRRIGVPWLIAILLVVPMVRYAGEMKSATATFIPFWQYWLEYCAGTGTVRFGQAGVETMGQMHFWFLSLLLAFFIVLAGARATVLATVRAIVPALMGAVPAGRRILARERPARRPASSRSIYAAFAWTAGLATLAYLVVISIVPEASWMNIDLLLQFQPASLVLYAASFVLGTVAARGKWFEGDVFPARPAVWGAISVGLAAAFLLIGKGVFAEPLVADKLPLVTLLVFSVVRTFLCLSMLVMLVSWARGRRRPSSALTGRLAASSYSIYLCHLFFVVFLQDVLMAWQGGAPMAKAVIVFLLALPISYGVARAMDRFPKGFTAGLAAVFAAVMVLCR